MIKYDIDANDVIKYLAIIDNISSSGSTMEEKHKPKFLFRGESINHDYIIRPKYLRPLEGKGIHSDSCYLVDELDIIRQFRDEAISFLPNVGKEDYRTWREYAQHFGAPTKLLDLSSNPLVALYFACKDNADADGIVWMINWQNYHQNTNHEDINGDSLSSSSLSVSDTVDLAANGNPILNNPVIYKPCYIDTRMSAQSSYFMLWGVNKDDLITQIGSGSVKEGEYKRPKTEDGGNVTYNDSTILYYFIIDKEQKKRILLRLSRMGINEKTLFPGLDGVGKYIDAINKYSQQEHIDRLFGDL